MQPEMAVTHRLVCSRGASWEDGLAAHLKSDTRRLMLLQSADSNALVCCLAC